MYFCEGTKFASLIQGFYCICSFSINLNTTAFCSWRCTGNNNENCGGPGQIANVYQIGTVI